MLHPLFSFNKRVLQTTPCTAGSLLGVIEWCARLAGVCTKYGCAVFAGCLPACLHACQPPSVRLFCLGAVRGCVCVGVHSTLAEGSGFFHAEGVPSVCVLVCVAFCTGLLV